MKSDFSSLIVFVEKLFFFSVFDQREKVSFLKASKAFSYLLA